MQYFDWQKLTLEEQCRLLTRPKISYDKAVTEQTIAILEKVKDQGDAALRAFTQKFDDVTLDEFVVSSSEFDNAIAAITPDVKDAIHFARDQIMRYQQVQLPLNIQVETNAGMICERQARAIPSVGLYVPGGSAPLISTVLMLAVPAELAGNPVRILCTPPNKHGAIDPHILYAATICGIQQIFKVGGAQAIAGMAYGTNTIPKVDKIFGPGNQWVTLAKCLVAQDLMGPAIDLLAGPSELLVIADETANTSHVAADLLSQAEHGPDSQVILITPSQQLARTVQKEIINQLSDLPRKAIAEASLAYSHIFIVRDLLQAIDISNTYAPEHLILHVAQPDRLKEQINNAGAVFIGPWTPETLGDYVTGANHVLPTSGFARKASGLSVTDFMKYIHFQTASYEGFKKLAPYAEMFAQLEGLAAHRAAITLRTNKKVLL